MEKKVFQTNSRTVEVLSLKHNVKPAIRLAIYQPEETTIQKYLENNNLKYTISDFYINEIQDKGKGGFSNKGVKTNTPTQFSYRYYYISKKNPNQLKQAEKENNNILLGKLLGYPACCTEFFQKNWLTQSKRQNDYIIPALSNHDSFPYHTNICARYFDQILISHFPCSFNCKESINQAKKIEKVTKKYSIPTDLLKSIVIYTEFNGVFLLPSLQYKNFQSTTKNHIHDLLNNHDSIEIINQNQIKIGKYSLEKIHVLNFGSDHNL